MVIVETPIRSIEQQIREIEALPDGPNSRLYTLGALQALRWIKDGAIPPSRINEVLKNV